MHSFENFNSFWNMGGYAAYVWSAYGILLIFLLVNFLWPFKQHRLLKARLRKKEIERRA